MNVTSQLPITQRDEVYFIWLMITHWVQHEPQTVVYHSESKVGSRWRLVTSSLCPQNKCQISKLTSQVRALSFNTGKPRNKKKKETVWEAFQSTVKIWDEGSTFLKGNTDLRIFLKLGEILPWKKWHPSNAQLAQSALAPLVHHQYPFLWGGGVWQELHWQNRDHWIAKIDCRTLHTG